MIYVNLYFPYMNIIYLYWIKYVYILCYSMSHVDSVQNITAFTKNKRVSGNNKVFEIPQNQFRIQFSAWVHCSITWDFSMRWDCRVKIWTEHYLFLVCLWDALPSHNLFPLMLIFDYCCRHLFSSSPKKNFVLLLGCSYISLTDVSPGWSVSLIQSRWRAFLCQAAWTAVARCLLAPAGSSWPLPSLLPLLERPGAASPWTWSTVPPRLCWPPSRPAQPLPQPLPHLPIASVPQSQTPPNQLPATSAPCWRNSGSSTLDLHPEPHPQWLKCLSRRRTICRSLEMRGPHLPAGSQNSRGRPRHPPLHPQTRPTTARTTTISPCHNPKTKRTRTRPRAKQARHPKRSQW